MTASRPVHFEMTAEKPDRLAEFYGKVFGWTFQKWDGPMDYWMVTTGEGDMGINEGVCCCAARRRRLARLQHRQR